MIDPNTMIDDTVEGYRFMAVACLREMTRELIEQDDPQDAAGYKAKRCAKTACVNGPIGGASMTKSKNPRPASVVTRPSPAARNEAPVDGVKPEVIARRPSAMSAAFSFPRCPCMCSTSSHTK